MSTKEQVIKDILENSNGSWVDMITEGYEAGYASSSPSMQWVKASERLPDNSRTICRVVGSYMVGSEYHKNLGFYIGSYWRNDFQHIEWLSETPSPTLSIKDGKEDDWIPNYNSPEYLERLNELTRTQPLGDNTVTNTGE